MDGRIERIQLMLDTLNISRYELAKRSGLAASNLNKMMTGDQTVTDKTLHKIASAFPQVNIDWLKTGEGVMLNPGFSGNLTNGSGQGTQGTTTVGRDMMNNSEKLLEDFIDGLKTQNRLTEKAMEENASTRSLLDRSMNQTDKAMEQITATRSQLDRSMDQVDKLISIIQNNLIK